MALNLDSAKFVTNAAATATCNQRSDFNVWGKCHFCRSFTLDSTRTKASQNRPISFPKKHYGFRYTWASLPTATPNLRSPALAGYGRYARCAPTRLAWVVSPVDGAILDTRLDGVAPSTDSTYRSRTLHRWRIFPVRREPVAFRAMVMDGLCRRDIARGTLPPFQSGRL